MNLKFFLSLSLCLGCLFMIFMWHSANKINKESQNYEKQFLSKIASLESENKMELKLIDALRVDIAKNEKELKVKSNLLETLQFKEKRLEDEKEKLQLTIENIKKEYEKVNKDNNQWLDNWKVEFKNNSENERSNIHKLEGDLEFLKTEYSNLQLVAKNLPTDASVESMQKNKDGNDDKSITEDEFIKNDDLNKEDKRRRQAKPPIVKKDKNEEVAPKELLVDKDDNEKAPLQLESVKKQNQKPANIDDHHLQAKAPVIKSEKNEGYKVVQQDISDKSKVKANQLMKPRPEAPKDKKVEKKMNEKPNEDKSDMDKNVNPKIIKKDNNPQVKPPVHRRIWDDLKKNIKDGDFKNDQSNMDKPVNEADNYNSALDNNKQIKKKFQDSKNLNNNVME